MDTVEALEGIVLGKLRAIGTLFSMFKLEAKLAGMSIIPFILNLWMMTAVLSGLWLSVLSLLSFFIFKLTYDIGVTLSIILVFNIVCLTLLVYFLMSNLRKMSFEKTRKYLSSTPNEDVNNDIETSKEINTTD